MCGRYNISDSKHIEAIAEQIGLVIDPLPQMFNIAPTGRVPVLFQQSDAPAFDFMRWWLVPSWSSGPSSKYAMFNARAETLVKSRAYQKPIKSQRAIIPASSFIEWKTESGGKQPYLIQSESGGFAFAGLWDHWTDGEQNIYSCSIITTQATEGFSQLHKRMPVMLKDDELSYWLDSATQTTRIQDMLKPKALEDLLVTPISKAVNNSSNKGSVDVIGGSIKINS